MRSRAQIVALLATFAVVCGFASADGGRFRLDRHLLDNLSKCRESEGSTLREQIPCFSTLEPKRSEFADVSPIRNKEVWAKAEVFLNDFQNLLWLLAEDEETPPPDKAKLIRDSIEKLRFYIDWAIEARQEDMQLAASQAGGEAESDGPDPGLASQGWQAYWGSSRVVTGVSYLMDRCVSTGLLEDLFRHYNELADMDMSVFELERTLTGWGKQLAAFRTSDEGSLYERTPEQVRDALESNRLGLIYTSSWEAYLRVLAAVKESPTAKPGCKKYAERLLKVYDPVQTWLHEN